jgi:hypothetical protein
MLFCPNHQGDLSNGLFFIELLQKKEGTRIISASLFLLNTNIQLMPLGVRKIMYLIPFLYELIVPVTNLQFAVRQRLDEYGYC